MEERHSETLMNVYVSVHCKLPRSLNSFEVKLHGHGYFVRTILELVDKEKVGSKSLNGVRVSGKQRVKHD